MPAVVNTNRVHRERRMGTQHRIEFDWQGTLWRLTGRFGMAPTDSPLLVVVAEAAATDDPERRCWGDEAGNFCRSDATVRKIWTETIA